MPDRVVTYDFRGKFGNLTAGLATAGRNVGELNTKLLATDVAGRKMRSGLTDIGNTAGKIGLVAAAGLGAVVAAAANFDQAMSNVQAATHETADNMELLRHAAIEAGQATIFSASEAAAAIENLAKAGVSTQDILGGGLNGALSLAAAGGLEVADAAEIAATAMTQFKLSGKDVPHIADLLAAGAGKAQGDVTDMSMALKQAGLVASQAGLSIEETTGALASFASAGLLGSDAGTSFRTMLLRLNPQSDQAAKLIEKYNLAAFDAQGNFIGLANYAQKLQNGLKNLSVEQRQAALSTIFGTDAIRAANVLYDQGARGITDWTNKVNDSGYAAETASIRMDNLKGDLEQFRGSLETALIGAGEGSQGPLRELVQDATAAVNAFNELPGPIKNTATAMLAITAITGGALWFGSKIIRGIVDTRTALDNLGPSATSTATKLGRLGAKGATILVAAQAIGALVNATTDLGNAVDSSGIADELDRIAAGDTTDSLGKLSGALEGANEAGAGLTHTLFKVPSALIGIKDSFNTNKDTIEAFDQQLADLVKNGNADKAAAAFQAIRDAAARHGGVSDNDVVKQFDAYNDALSAGSGAANLMRDALFGLVPPSGDAATATGALGTAAEATRANLEAEAKALEESRKAASDTAHEFVTLGDSLNDSKVSLNDWIRQMRKQADALRDFTKNAQTAGKRGLREGLIAELEKAGPEGALRMKQLADGTKEQIREANRAWASGQAAVRAYVNQVGGVPPSVGTTLNLTSAAAEAGLARILHQIKQIPPRLQTDYYVIQHNALVKPRVLPGNPDGGADGATVPSSGLGYADRWPYLLADGEEVVSDRYGGATRNRPELKAASRGAKLAIVSMADGGTAERLYRRPLPTTNAWAPQAGAGAAIDYAQLAAAVSGSRLLAHRDTRDAMLSAMRTALGELPIVRGRVDLASLPGVL